MIINSLQNEKIKNIVKLLKSSRERLEQGLFTIEGYREISLAMAGNVEIVNIFYCAELSKRSITSFKIAPEKIIELAPKVLKKLSLRENPDGFLALAKMRQAKLDDIKLKINPLVIILEAIEKPGNLGAILRTADAAGADAVIINQAKTDIYNPNVIRASQGTVFTVPVVVASGQATREWCNKNKIKIFATAPTAKKEYFGVDFRKGSAILLGAEDKGLSQEWLTTADEQIKIKMRGKIDSLNVSASAAIILFEALRQRQ